MLAERREMSGDGGLVCGLRLAQLVERAGQRDAQLVDVALEHLQWSTVR